MAESIASAWALQEELQPKWPLLCRPDSITFLPRRDSVRPRASSHHPVHPLSILPEVSWRLFKNDWCWAECKSRCRCTLFVEVSNLLPYLFGSLELSIDRAHWASPHMAVCELLLVWHKFPNEYIGGSQKDDLGNERHYPLNGGCHMPEWVPVFHRTRPQNHCCFLCF